MNTIATWRPVLDFPGYEVSDDGRIRNWNRRERRWRNPRSSCREQPFELPGTAVKHGYRAFFLTTGGKQCRRLLHRVVAFAFLGQPPSPLHTDVAHLDGNPSHNHLSNLRWMPHAENQRMMAEHGTMQYGTKSVTCKLAPEDVAEIRKQAAAGPRGTKRRMAEKYGVSYGHITGICQGIKWAHTF